MSRPNEIEGTDPQTMQPTPDQAGRIAEEAIGEITLLRYEDGDITLYEDTPLGLLLTPAQAGTFARNYPINQKETINLGRDDQDRTATLSRRTSDQIEIETENNSLKISTDTAQRAVEWLQFWNYDQYAPSTTDTLELNADHVQALLEFAEDNHPKNGIGWCGEFAEAIIECHTELYGQEITVAREPLETLVAWLENESETDTGPMSTVRNVNRRLTRFGTDIVVVDRKNLEKLLNLTKEHPKLESVPKHSNVFDAIEKIESMLDD